MRGGDSLYSKIKGCGTCESPDVQSPTPGGLSSKTNLLEYILLMLYLVMDKNGCAKCAAPNLSPCITLIHPAYLLSKPGGESSTKKTSTDEPTGS